MANRKIKLDNLRVAFPPNLFEAVQYQGAGEFKYNLELLVKDDSPQFKTIMDVIEELAAEAWKAKAKANLAEIFPDKKACCFIAGPRKSDKDEFVGHHVLGVKRKAAQGRPLILGPDIDDRTGRLRHLEADSGKPYSGCFVNVEFDLYTQEKPNMGIRGGLLVVQFARDGDTFGAGSTPTEGSFGQITDGAGAEDMA